MLSYFTCLVTFYLVVLSVVERGTLKYPQITVNMSIFLCSLILFGSYILELCCLVHTHLGFYVFVVDLPLIITQCSSLLLVNFVGSSVYFI